MHFQRECSERVSELGEYFSGTKALTRVKKNETLEKWFHDISTQIKGLDYKDSVLAGRKIHQLIQALQQVEEFQQVETRFFHIIFMFLFFFCAILIACHVMSCHVIDVSWFLYFFFCFLLLTFSFFLIISS